MIYQEAKARAMQNVDYCSCVHEGLLAGAAERPVPVGATKGGIRPGIEESPEAIIIQGVQR